MKTNYMTTEFTIQAADNGMTVSGEELVQVIENTHVINGTGYDNLIHELGRIFYGEILDAMNAMLANNVRVKIEISKED